MMFVTILLALGLTAVHAIPIDNGVQGNPEIECGPRSIQVTFNTFNNFEGHVYVKGLYDQDAAGCRTTGDGTRQVAGIELPFDGCNVVRERSANPKGIFVRTTVVITFHPNFITKVDRAYTLQCFYMEADKTVSTDIEVSMITTGFQTQFVPMPICRYEILDSPTGNQVPFAIIGQAVYHKWTCDTETVDTFCMFVYSCFVVDPAGADRLDLIDEQGCATDRYLMGNIEYPTDLMGVKEVHVFKYADRPALFFQCQINIAVKEPNADCIRPQCAEPQGRGDGNPNARRQFSTARQVSPRGRRSVFGQEVDVSSEISILDVNNDASRLIVPDDLLHRGTERYAFGTQETEGVCLSPVTVGLVGAVVLCLAVAVIVVASVYNNRSRKQYATGSD